MPGSSSFSHSSNNICKIPDCSQPSSFNTHVQQQLDYCEAHLVYVSVFYHALASFLTSTPALNWEDLRLLAGDAEDCRSSEIQNIVANSVRAEVGRHPVCLWDSHQLARSVVAPSQRTCGSTVGISAARSVGTPTVLPIRPVAIPDSVIG